MKKMRITAAVLTAVLLCLCLAGCGEEPPATAVGRGVYVDPEQSFTVAATAEGVYTAEIGI